MVEPFFRLPGRRSAKKAFTEKREKRVSIKHEVTSSILVGGSHFSSSPVLTCGSKSVALLRSIVGGLLFF